MRKLGRHEEALREFEVGLHVPYELDGDVLIAEAMQGMAGPEGQAEGVEGLFEDATSSGAAGDIVYGDGRLMVGPGAD